MISRIATAVGRLYQHELATVAVLFFARLLVRPYMGLVSDAQLYSMQVLSRIHPGHFNADLFLKYGSQDNFSVFSVAVAPLASVAGVRLTFFVLYGICLFALLWGEVRLIRRLLPHGMPAIAGLLLLAATDVPYAWQGNFSVHECYFTARLPAQALAVWGVALVVQGRFLPSAGLALLATALHPLMGVGALALCLSVWTAERLSARALIVAIGAGVLALLALISQPHVAERVLRGRMDAQWLETVRIASPQCLITEWWASDWVRTAVAIAVMAAGAWLMSGRSRILAAAVAFLGLAGVGVSLLAEVTGYVLLVQGQAYRSLWYVQLLAIPIGMHLAGRAWTSDRPVLRVASLAILAYFGEVFVQPRLDPSWILFALVVAGSQCVFWSFVLARRPKASEGGRKWILAAAFSLAGTAVALSATHLPSLVSFASQASLGVPRLFWVLPRYVSDGMLAGIGLALAGAAGCLPLTSRRLAANMAVAGAAVLLGWFAVSDIELGDARRRGDRDFVQRFVDSHPRDTSRPQVYWPTDLGQIWFGLSTASYYNWTQLSGIAFSRETALESRRRARLARPFELAHLKALYDSPETWHARMALMDATWSDPAPGQPDLERLAADRELDWIVLSVEYPGAVAATNGSVFVYDCDRLRRP